MASDEKYIDCPKCGYSVLTNLNSRTKEWGGYCNHCEDHIFSKNRESEIEINYCPICGVKFDEPCQSNKEMICIKCCYKFEVMISNEY